MSKWMIERGCRGRWLCRGRLEQLLFLLLVSFGNRGIKRGCEIFCQDGNVRFGVGGVG